MLQVSEREAIMHIVAKAIEDILNAREEGKSPCPYLAKTQVKQVGHGKANPPRRVEQYDKRGRLLNTWSSVGAASEALGITRNAIYQNCAGQTKLTGARHRQPTTARFKFVYAD